MPALIENQGPARCSRPKSDVFEYEGRQDPGTQKSLFHYRLAMNGAHTDATWMRMDEKYF